MKRLERSDILTPDLYEPERMNIRRRIKEIKECRRVQMGPHFMFLFENFETAVHQVQETLRTDNKTSEEEIAHELDQQNQRLADAGELACSLLIQVDGLDEREVKLREWIDLPQHIFLVVDVGSHVPARFDPRQVTEGRMSSVQYLKFDCKSKQPVALVCTRPGMEQRMPLELPVRAALAEDLGIEVPE